MKLGNRGTDYLFLLQYRQKVIATPTTLNSKNTTSTVYYLNLLTLDRFPSVSNKSAGRRRIKPETKQST